MRNLLLALTVAMSATHTFAQTNNGVIEGRALHATSREPLPGVQITLTAPTPGSATSNLSAEAAARLADQIANLIETGNRLGVGQDAIDNAIATTQRNAGATVGPQTSVLSDSNGYFSFKDLGPGRYNIRASREGYFGPPANGTSPAAVSKNVTIEGGKAAVPVELPLVQGGIISGRIRDPNGQAVSGVTVQTYRVTYTNGRKTWSTVNSKATDDRGEYRIFWLPPGEYYVGITPRTPGTIPGPQDSWARTFYPGAIEPDGASMVLLNKGGEATGIDINIRTGSTALFKITGVAKNPYARPNPTTGVVDQSLSSFILAPRDPGLLDSINPPSVQNAIPVNARPNGEFEIRNVRPGSYDLYPYYIEPIVAPSPAPGAVPPPPPANRRYMVSRNPIEVRNGDINGLTIAIGPGATLSGEVVVTGTGPQAVKLESVRLAPRNLGTMPVTFSSIMGTISVDASGKFSAAGVPQERYTFTVSGIPDTAFVADIRQGAASAYDSGVVLDDNANPVQIVIDAGGVQVDGTVLNAEHKPAAGATVVLVPPPGRRQNSALYKNVVSDDSGHFTFKGVPPGQYTVYGWESVLPSAWQNADYLRNYEARGRPLTVERQSHPEIQVDLIPLEAERR